jgi:hypothetical protein
LESSFALTAPAAAPAAAAVPARRASAPKSSRPPSPSAAPASKRSSKVQTDKEMTALLGVVQAREHDAGISGCWRLSGSNPL